MNHSRLLLVIVLVWQLSATGAIARRTEKIPAPLQAKVGMMTLSFMDENRKNWQGTAPRPLRTAIWYPAEATATKEETIFGGPPEKEVFAPVTVASGAEISSASPKYPLILLSHGTGGAAIQMMWLGYYLASRGYVVAAVNHHGNTAAEDQPAAQGFLLYWERAKDLTVVLDKLLADPVFGGRIDRDRIGAAGFSLGGYTVISIAGGVFSLQEYESFAAPRNETLPVNLNRNFLTPQNCLQNSKRMTP